jgi:hypothetical protein
VDVLAWLGLQWIVFETPEGDGIVVGTDDHAVAWVAGAWPRVGVPDRDPSEQTLTFVAHDVSVCLVGGLEWTGRAHWAHTEAPSWQDASCPSPPSSASVSDWSSWAWGPWSRR